MIRKLKRDALQAETAALNQLARGVPSDAPLTALSFISRRDAIADELRQIEAIPDTTGSAALIFGGARVQGSRAIDADFAARGLRAYQDLVVKKAVQQIRGPMGQRGPVPDRDIARLNITGTIHGSFGFVLEEEGAETPALFPTVVKDAISSVSDLINAFTSEDESEFARALEEIDPRVLGSLKDLLKTLEDADGTIRIIEGDRDLRFARQSVERAFRRADQSSLEEREITVMGRLIGVLPISRTFELTREDTGEHIRGKVGPQLSSEFLRRIQEEALPLGERWRATLQSRTIERPSASPKVSYMLTGLEEASEA